MNHYRPITIVNVGSRNDGNVTVSSEPSPKKQLHISIEILQINQSHSSFAHW